MKKLFAVVVFPVQVEIDVPDDTDPENLSYLEREKLFSEASKIIEKDTIKPVIHEVVITG